MLRSVSSYRAFKWAYGNSEIDYIKIIDFLILNDKCPRSLYFSVEKINFHFNRLKRNYKQGSSISPKIEKLFKKLRKLSVNDILEEGLHDFLIIFIEEIAAVYQDLQSKYFIGT